MKLVRHSRLKISRLHGHAGSIPARGTTFDIACRHMRSKSQGCTREEDQRPASAAPRHVHGDQFHSRWHRPGDWRRPACVHGSRRDLLLRVNAAGGGGAGGSGFATAGGGGGGGGAGLQWRGVEFVQWRRRRMHILRSRYWWRRGRQCGGVSWCSRILGCRCRRRRWRGESDRRGSGPLNGDGTRPHAGRVVAALRRSAKASPPSPASRSG